MVFWGKYNFGASIFVWTKNFFGWGFVWLSMPGYRRFFFHLENCFLGGKYKKPVVCDEILFLWELVWLSVSGRCYFRLLIPSIGFSGFSIYPKIFLETAKNFMIFCRKIVFLKKMLFWSCWAKSVKNGPKLKLFKFYEKLTRGIFSNFLHERHTNADLKICQNLRLLMKIIC